MSAVTAFSATPDSTLASSQSSAESSEKDSGTVLRAKWKNQASQDRQAVVFVGDSVFARWSGLSAAFSEMKVANRSIEGDTARGMLMRLSEDVISLRPAAVVLLVGEAETTDNVQPEVVAGNMQLILEALQKNDPTMPIVVCEALPEAAGTGGTDRIKALNAALLGVTMNRPHVTYVEAAAQLAEASEATGEDSSQNHRDPSGGAYARLAKALRPIFCTLGLLKEQSDAFVPEPGFVSLFNGRDLTGWGYRPIPEDEIQGAKRRDAKNPRAPVRVFPEKAEIFNGITSTPEGRYLAQQGRIVVTTPPEYRKIQQLWTEREFADDLVLKLEFRATPNADSGVYIRGPQLQVRDYLVAGPYKQLKNYRPQEWNELVVTVRGEEAVCTCNGEVIETAFKVPAKGPIGLEGDRGQMEYRRIRVSVTPR